LYPKGREGKGPTSKRRVGRARRGGEGGERRWEARGGEGKK